MICGHSGVMIFMIQFSILNVNIFDNSEIKHIYLLKLFIGKKPTQTNIIKIIMHVPIYRNKVP